MHYVVLGLLLFVASFGLAPVDLSFGESRSGGLFHRALCMVMAAICVGWYWLCAQHQRTWWQRALWLAVLPFVNIWLLFIRGVPSPLVYPFSIVLVGPNQSEVLLTNGALAALSLIAAIRPQWIVRLKQVERSRVELWTQVILFVALQLAMIFFMVRSMPWELLLPVLVATLVGALVVTVQAAILRSLVHNSHSTWIAAATLGVLSGVVAAFYFWSLPYNFEYKLKYCIFAALAAISGAVALVGCSVWLGIVVRELSKQDSREPRPAVTRSQLESNNMSVAWGLVACGFLACLIVEQARSISGPLKGGALLSPVWKELTSLHTGMATGCLCSLAIVLATTVDDWRRRLLVLLVALALLATPTRIAVEGASISAYVYTVFFNRLTFNSEIVIVAFVSAWLYRTAAALRLARVRGTANSDQHRLDLNVAPRNVAIFAAIIGLLPILFFLLPGISNQRVGLSSQTIFYPSNSAMYHGWFLPSGENLTLALLIVLALVPLGILCLRIGYAGKPRVIVYSVAVLTIVTLVQSSLSYQFQLNNSLKSYLSSPAQPFFGLTSMLISIGCVALATVLSGSILKRQKFNWIQSDSCLMGDLTKNLEGH